jgi:hypothetical protein
LFNFDPLSCDILNSLQKSFISSLK